MSRPEAVSADALRRIAYALEKLIELSTNSLAEKSQPENENESELAQANRIIANLGQNLVQAAANIHRIQSSEFDGFQRARAYRNLQTDLLKLGSSVLPPSVVDSIYGSKQRQEAEAGVREAFQTLIRQAPAQGVQRQASQGGSGEHRPQEVRQEADDRYGKGWPETPQPTPVASCTCEEEAPGLRIWKESCPVHG